MCISIQPAEFKGTIVYNGAATDGSGDHVLGYQNVAINRSNGPNAMVFYVPSDHHLGPEHILDTRGCPNVLKDMATAWENAVRPRSRGPMTLGGSSRELRSAVIFDFDVYTIILGWPDGVNELLPQVPKHKRPPFHSELFAFLGHLQPNFQVAVCCFNNYDAKQAAPMMFRYQPLDPHMLFFPALDAHDGGLPNPQGTVQRDHLLLFSLPNGGATVRYTDHLPPPVQSSVSMNIGGMQLREIATAAWDAFDCTPYSI